jgi:hypothetical protein
VAILYYHHPSQRLSRINLAGIHSSFGIVSREYFSSNRTSIWSGTTGTICTNVRYSRYLIWWDNLSFGKRIPNECDTDKCDTTACNEYQSTQKDINCRKYDKASFDTELLAFDGSSCCGWVFAVGDTDGGVVVVSLTT